MTKQTVHPVILSGGSGTRLWPVSRAKHPKQLHALVSAQSMVAETARRCVLGAGNPPVDPGLTFAPPLVISSHEHRFIIAEQLRAGGVDDFAQILEPAPRNTAPAAAAAGAFVGREDPEAILLVMPADHVIRDLHAFYQAVALGAGAAAAGHLVTFGIVPAGPETGYGYIKRGDPTEGAGGAFEVDQFVEKPDIKTARAYLAAGNYYWNAGIFMFRADRLRDELAGLNPEILACCDEAVASGIEDLDFFRLDTTAFSRNPSISIDYAVMERSPGVVVVPVDMGWSDVGSWAALWEIGTKDDDGNVVVGDVIARDVTNSYLRSEDRLVAALGVDDIVLVETPDAVLVARRDRVQDVRDIVGRIREQDRTEHEEHKRTYRPWGYYETVALGDRHQVKHIMVKPGAKLSLQMHHHRSEHWVVVSGTARVERDGEVVLLAENESTYIPIGTRHRLENPGKVPLSLIEVQSGAYLGEDDIVRFDDHYGRHKEAAEGGGDAAAADRTGQGDHERG